VVGQVGAASAFLLVGAGLHTVQTTGLALATDLAPPASQPRVVALLCMMLLLGMVSSALLFGLVLAHFTPAKLIQVVQAAALATMALNLAALWRQEARNPALTATNRPAPLFSEAWSDFRGQHRAIRRLVALALGTIGFSMQDVLLEPYGGQVLHLPVGATTGLTAGLAIGGLCGFALAARALGRGTDPYRFSAVGTLAGLAAFGAVLASAPLGSALVFAAGVMLIGFGAGLFAHCTLTAAMAMAQPGQVGLALGIWGAVQASAAGSAAALGGLIRDAVPLLSARHWIGSAFATPSAGYAVVYGMEAALLILTLIAAAPLAGVVRAARVGPLAPLTEVRAP
jgi:BCD family chlorophyll transporter-like MFS transporter